jgi:hypothetical protein
MKKAIPISLIFIVGLTGVSFGQDTSLASICRKVADINPERIYVHLSTDVSFPGDTIAFSAWITQGNMPSRSTSLYVELLDEHGSVAFRGRFLVYEGSSVGYVSIPSEVPVGIYYFKSYTSWSSNGGIASPYYVPISVTNGTLMAVPDPSTKSQHVNATYSDGLGMTCLASKSGVFAAIFMDDSAQYENMKMRLLLISRSVMASKDLALKKKESSVMFTFQENAVEGEEIDVILLSGRTVMLQNKVIVPAKQEFADIVADTISKDKRGFNSWKISIKDTAIGRLSVSVIDADVDGYGLYAKKYGSTTQMNYQKIVDGDSFSHRVDSNYLSFSGKVVRGHSKKEAKVDNLIAFTTTKDSSRTLQRIPLDSARGFQFTHNIFFDTLTVFFSGEGKGFKSKDVKILLDPMTSSPLYADSVAHSIKKLSSTHPLNVAAKAKDSFLLSELGKILPEVRVQAPIKSMEDKLDEAYSSPGFSGIDEKRFDVMNDPNFLGMDIFDYIQRSMPAIEISMDEQGNRNIYYRRQKLLIFIDGMELPPGFGSMLPSASSIAYIKVIPNCVMAFLMQGIVAIYTKKGHELERGHDTSPGLSKIALPGYTAPVLRSTSSYPGGRTVLYWNPSISGESRIMFHNNDYTKKFKIVIKGIGLKGEFLYFEKIIE